MVKQNLQVSAI